MKRFLTISSALFISISMIVPVLADEVETSGEIPPIYKETIEEEQVEDNQKTEE